MSEDVLLMLELSGGVDNVDVMMGDESLKTVDIQSFDPSDTDEQILRAIDYMSAAQQQPMPRKEEEIL